VNSQPIKKTKHPPHVDGDMPKPEVPDCSSGHRAQWSGSLNSYHGGAVLGAVIRGIVSAGTRLAAEILIDHMNSDNHSPFDK
jgi:hypothetical protein